MSTCLLPCTISLFLILLGPSTSEVSLLYATGALDCDNSAELNVGETAPPPLPPALCSSDLGNLSGCHPLLGIGSNM